MKPYEKIFSAALAEGGLLDALLAAQAQDGYVTEDAIRILAAHVGVSPAQLYDTASFYSMLRFEAPAPVEIRVCRGTACHSCGNGELVAALEAATGLKIGESSRQYSLGWVECLGQCQDVPNLLINGKLYTNVELDKIPALLGGAE